MTGSNSVFVKRMNHALKFHENCIFQNYISVSEKSYFGFRNGTETKKALSVWKYWADEAERKEDKVDLCQRESFKIGNDRIKKVISFIYQECHIQTTTGTSTTSF